MAHFLKIEFVLCEGPDRRQEELTTFGKSGFE